MAKRKFTIEEKRRSAEFTPGRDALTADCIVVVEDESDDQGSPVVKVITFKTSEGVPDPDRHLNAYPPRRLSRQSPRGLDQPAIRVGTVRAATAMEHAPRPGG